MNLVYNVWLTLAVQNSLTLVSILDEPKCWITIVQAVFIFLQFYSICISSNLFQMWMIPRETAHEVFLCIGFRLAMIRDAPARLHLAFGFEMLHFEIQCCIPCLHKTWSPENFIKQFQLFKNMLIFDYTYNSHFVKFH